MKLILLSKHFTENAFNKLLLASGKKAPDLKIMFSINAADMDNGDKPYIQPSRDELYSFGLRFTETDLREFMGKTEELREYLGGFDATFFTGGSSMYLAYLFKKLGMYEFYPEMVKKGLIHMGCSAGGMIAAPSMKYAKIIDSTEGVPEIVDEGLNLCPLYFAPHYGNKEKYTKKYDEIVAKHLEPGDKIIPLENHRGIYVDDSSWELI